jgi:hypothetical protein
MVRLQFRIEFGEGGLWVEVRVWNVFAVGTICDQHGYIGVGLGSVHIHADQAIG